MMFGDKSEQVGVDNVAAAEKEEKLDDATREGQSSRLLAESGFDFFLLVGRSGVSSVCVVGRRIGCPESQIVTQ